MNKRSAYRLFRAISVAMFISILGACGGSGGSSSPASTTIQDSDSDGVIDDLDAFPNDPLESQDVDGDGVGDNSDNCVDIANDNQTNTDSSNDGGDLCDHDDDNDNVLDDIDKFPLDPLESIDSDGDGIGDTSDLDDDGDGIEDNRDNCQIISNSDQVDTDKDDVGDLCDEDDDGDKIADQKDNCPLVVNTDQSNVDNDLDGDLCDNDKDNDGVIDSVDVDDDDDGLIEIWNLDDLDDIRNHLDGSAQRGSDSGCSSNGNFTCYGFELVVDLDFDTNGDGVMDQQDEYFDADNDGSNSGWLPIGGLEPTGFEEPFTATFDGNGHTISNLYIYRPAEDLETRGHYIGLFGVVNYGYIKNVGLTGDLASVTASTLAGGLVGLATNRTYISNSYSTRELKGLMDVGGLVGVLQNYSSINNSYATGSISDTGLTNPYSASRMGGLVGVVSSSKVFGSYSSASVNSSKQLIGGLVGEATHAEIHDSYANGSVASDGHVVGGLIGKAELSEISRCYSTGSVMSIGNVVGGFIGRALDTEINESYATGYVKAGGHIAGGFAGNLGQNSTLKASFSFGSVSGDGIAVGGLVGSIDNSTVSSSFSSGSVSGSDDVGGIAGQAILSSIISTSFAVGPVTGNGDTGGLVGDSEGTVYSHNYFAIDTTLQLNAIGDNRSSDPIFSEIYGVSLQEMKCPVTANSLACASSLLYVSWDTWLDDDDKAYWNFGSNEQLPGLVMDNMLHRFIDEGKDKLNIQPKAIAGSDQTIGSGEAVTLDGSDSYDSDGTIVAYSWTENGIELSSEVSFTKADFAIGNHNVVLTVTDDDDSEASSTVVVTVTSPSNMAPTAIAGSDQTVGSGEAVMLDGSDSYDSDGTIVAYSWTENGIELSSEVSFTKADFATGNHNVVLTVKDDDDSEASSTVVVTVTSPSNMAPAAIAGSDQTIGSGEAVTLDGSDSNDSDGTIIEYSWTENGIELSSDVSFTKSNFTIGNHSVILTVTDDDGAVSSDTVVITVNSPPNIPPTADAGTNQTLIIGEVAIFDGTASYDSDGTIVAFRWSENGIELSSEASFTKTDFAAGDHNVIFSVVDNTGALATDTIRITVKSPLSYSVGGTVAGLNGILNLKLGSMFLNVTQNGIFTFDEEIDDGSNYRAVISLQPENQKCEITNNSGAIRGDNISDITIVCASLPETAPLISSVWPGEVASGLEVKVSGSYLEEASIAVNGEAVVPTMHNEHEIRFIAPELPAGTYQLDVENDYGDSLNDQEYKKLLKANKFTAGSSHSCALINGGTVKCWGWNEYGQLGDGSKSSSVSPVTVSGLNEVTDISAGGIHSCALIKDGTVQCWGNNTQSQLGIDGSTVYYSTTPVSVSGLSNVVDIVAGRSHTCALMFDGTVKCWGSNFRGKLGNGSTTESFVPVVVSGLSEVTAISVGDHHTCALKTDNTVRCWGYNQYGQLGNGSTEHSSVPVTVDGLTEVVAIGTGENHTCALKTDNTVRCWGSDKYGVLGDGKATGYSAIPVTVLGLNEVVELAVGGLHNCTLNSEGAVQCWGFNTFGQLGDGTTENSSTPLTVINLNDVVSIGAGGAHSCAVKADSTVRCWGYNGSGTLGDYSKSYAFTPVTVSELPRIVSINAAPTFTCSVDIDDTVQCWGYNEDGLTGSGSKVLSPSPVTISDLSGVFSIATGANHACALLNSGAMQCWGRNSSGQLGNGSYDQISTPVMVSGLGKVTEITAGGHHTCGLNLGGTVQCWGGNSSGQLGDGSTKYSANPVMVKGLSDVSAIAAGDTHSCALKNNGTVLCWGNNNFGQLGNGSTTKAAAPVRVAELSEIIDITTGQYHTCALKSNGTVYCWGYNNKGQLGGNNTDAKSTAALIVSGLSEVASIAACNSHTCAVKKDSTVQCWGYNHHGELGDGSNTDTNMPVSVKDLVDVEAITGGDFHTCALLKDGAVMCWGGNFWGETGQKRTYYSPKPPIKLP